MKKLCGGLLLLIGTYLCAMGPGELSIRDSSVWVTRDMFGAAEEKDRHIARERAERIAHVALDALRKKSVVPGGHEEHVTQRAVLAGYKALRLGFLGLLAMSEETDDEGNVVERKRELLATPLSLVAYMQREGLINSHRIQRIGSELLRRAASDDIEDIGDFESWYRYSSAPDNVRVALYPFLTIAMAMFYTRLVDISYLRVAECPADSWFDAAWENNSDTMQGIYYAISLAIRLFGLGLGAYSGYHFAGIVDRCVLPPTIVEAARQYGVSGDVREYLERPAGLSFQCFRWQGLAERLRKELKNSPVRNTDSAETSLRQTHGSSMQDNEK